MGIKVQDGKKYSKKIIKAYMSQLINICLKKLSFFLEIIICNKNSLDIFLLWHNFKIIINDHSIYNIRYIEALNIPEKFYIYISITKSFINEIQNNVTRKAFFRYFVVPF